MSLQPERLWPPKEEEPEMTVIIGGQSFRLTWDNCYIQTYRTKDENYDEDLQQFSHLVYEVSRYEDPQGFIHRNFQTVPLSSLNPRELSYLIDNAYPISVNPKLDRHVLDKIADDEAATIPDFCRTMHNPRKMV